MSKISQREPTILVIFGAAGDLAWRKLVPALYNLFLDNLLPEKFAIVGSARKPLDNEAFRQRLHEGVDRFSRLGHADGDAWNRFASNIVYISEEIGAADSGSVLKSCIEEIEAGWKVRANRVYYLAIPPTMMESAAAMLQRLGVCKNCKLDRIVVEKPFGRDLASARALNHYLDSIFDESQIYRIDHYLGKETVQNILAFRFANSLFEPIWNRSYIDHVQITVAETVGVETRGEYFDHAGVLRDMVQNHLLQILCLIAMEPPISFEADEIRNKKVDVLRAIRPIRSEEIHQVAVRGQYRKGFVLGNPVAGYREEPKVAAASSTETFAALKLKIDNWRWQGVPFYLRTGKRLPVKVSEVSIIFRSPPHQFFPSAAVESWQPNRIVIRIQPEEGIGTRIQVKHPGTRLLLGAAEMQFRYREAFNTVAPEAYETLLLDVIRGDATLFMRADQVECAWGLVAPILEAWESLPATDFPDYPAGSWGPVAADLMIAREGHSWLQPELQGRQRMIRVFEDIDALSRAAAEIFVLEAGKAIRERNHFNVVLAGGETPRRLYELLAKQPYAGRISWEQVHVFWGDERCVPVTDLRSNLLMARRALLDHVAIPPDNIHPVPCDKSPGENAAAYEELVRSHFKDDSPRFDLVLLGLGEDGHTASIFPGTTGQGCGCLVDVAHKTGEDIMRVTFTAALINMAATAVFLVSGSSKAKTVKDVLEGPENTCRLPAQLIIMPVGRVIWMVDRDAASLLDERGLSV